MPKPAHLLAAAVAAVLASTAIPTGFSWREAQVAAGLAEPGAPVAVHLVGSEAAYGANLGIAVSCTGNVNLEVLVDGEVRARSACANGLARLSVVLSPSDAGSTVYLVAGGAGRLVYNVSLAYRVPTPSPVKLALLAAAVALAAAAAWLSVRERYGGRQGPP